ncbi:MAG TPA: peptide chain release factor 1, partial [Planctomycetaceae bacterium]|nr:peptide chain release factor 1 [Planctomycetaceae bacterium]
MKFPTLQVKLDRYEELEKELQDPEVLANTSKLVEIQREYGGLAKVALAVREFNTRAEDIEVAREMLEEETDPAAREYAQKELDELCEEHEKHIKELEDLVVAGDSITRGGLIMEIRAGAGGDEAALFARELFDMYMHFVEAQKGWKTEVLNMSATELGGLKEVTFSIAGEGAYHRLQFESGGHRVQRVPETETQGRVHTSAATVAVLPEASEVEVDIKP